MTARATHTLSAPRIAFLSAALLAWLLLPPQASANGGPELSHPDIEAFDGVGYGQRPYRRSWSQPQGYYAPPAYGYIFSRRGRYYWFPRVPGYPYYAPYAWPHYPPY